MFLVPKSALGIHLRFKNPKLSFAIKSLPSGCLAAHFSNGSFLALHHNLGRGDVHTDKVPNPTLPKNKLPFPCSLFTGIGGQSGAPKLSLPSIPARDGCQYGALDFSPLGHFSLVLVANMVPTTSPCPLSPSRVAANISP